MLKLTRRDVREISTGIVFLLPNILGFLAFTTIPLFRFVLNSFIMAGSITIAQIITCSLAAFAFS